jgi:hypothetical protein
MSDEGKENSCAWFSVTDAARALAETEEPSESLWYSAQLDGRLPFPWWRRIASQARLPAEASMGALRAGERCGPDGRCGRLRFHLDHHLLVAEELHACPPMNPSAPVMPEKRLTPHSERVQENAHLARLCGLAAIPLALLAQRAGAATANAGSINHTQAAIGFPVLLMRDQSVPSRAPQGPIWLEREV